MSTSWKLNVLRDQIRTSSDDYEYALDVIDSIANGINIFRYHAFTAKEALDDFLNETMSPDINFVALMLGAGDNQNEFQAALIANEANTIASIYTVRSLFDLIAQLIRHIFLRNSLSIDKCDIHRVYEKLDVSNPVKAVLASAIESDEFKYISAFINMTKHQAMIKNGTLLDVVNDKAGVKFKAFTYNGRDFPEIWSRDLLANVVGVKNHIIAIGKEINRQALMVCV